MNFITRKLIEWNRDEVMKWAFSTQKKQEWQMLCDVAFIDSAGKKYYRYRNDLDIPLIRFEQMQIFLMEYEARISRKTVTEWIEAANEVINRKDTKQLRTELGHLLGALRDRCDLLFEPDILLNLAMVQYIREDESPFVYDSEVQEEKIKQLLKDKGEGLYFFFHEQGLNGYLPRFITSPESLKLLTANMKAQTHRFQKLLDVLPTGQKSTNGLKTEDMKK